MNTYKVLVIQPFHEEGMRILEARDDVRLEVIDTTDEAAITAAIRDADAVTLRVAKLPARVIEQAERLKVVSRHGVGYDNVDVLACSRRGIVVTITAAANAVAVAEHALGLMLALSNQVLPYDRATRSGDWTIKQRLPRFELAGKRLLIVGFGRIGRQVARRAEALGMEVDVYDPYVDPEVIGRAGYGQVQDLRGGLGGIDVLTLHTPLTSETRGMIGADELALLPAHAILINTARGGIVDEAALADALRNGRLAGAGLDVFAEEPPPRDHPLFALDNVVLSPHAAGPSREAGIRMAVAVARNTLAALDGRVDPEMVVNPEVLRRR
ncbi:MAG TPA: hydroxyacid dehydrogenase [Geminicoccaceae bacterium]